MCGDEFGGTVRTRRGGGSESLPTLGAVNFNPGTHIVRTHPVNTGHHSDNQDCSLLQ